MNGLCFREEQEMVLRGACLSRSEESVVDSCREKAGRVEAGAEKKHELKISSEKRMGSIPLILRTCLVMRGGREEEGILNVESTA